MELSTSNYDNWTMSDDDNWTTPDYDNWTMSNDDNWTMSNYDNWSDYDPDEVLCNLQLDPEEIMAQAYTQAIICAFGLMGNTLVILTYAFYKRTKTMTDVYLFNMAVADLLFVLALPFITYNEQHNWSMGLVSCKILGAAYSVNLYSGMLLLACISVDRYIAIVQARRFFGARSRTLTYGRITCCAVWVFAVLLTLPTFIYTKPSEGPGLGTSAVVTCQLSFNEHETARLIKLLVPSLQMSIGFLLPLVVMMFCYFSVIGTLLRTQSSQRHKAVRVVLAVVVVFIVCHLPYNVALMNHTMSLFKVRSCAVERIKLRVLAFSRGVAYLHCCLNPVLYAFVGVKFRSHFQQIMRDLWCISKKYIYPAVRSSRGTSDVCVSFKSSDGNNNMSSFSA